MINIPKEYLRKLKNSACRYIKKKYESTKMLDIVGKRNSYGI